MGFFEITKELLNVAFTENGDKAYATTGNACLDYYSLVGGMRFNLKDALYLFMKAYLEDPIKAIKILFYTRDIREGLGERSIFRFTFNTFASMYPEVAKELLKFIPVYGRYDDLLACFDSPIRKEVMNIVKEQLQKDLEAKKNNEPISLLAKWLPSVNASNFETIDLACRIAQSLGMSKKEYRQMLSFLRKGVIIENNLREKDYSFSYDKIPSNASFKYRKAFLREDEDRYTKYLEDVKKGTAKINTKVLYPYEVIRVLERNNYLEEELDSLDVIWNNYPRENIASRTIVVRDGSGSMLDDNAVSANSVATSLALLFAEQLTGEFKNKFITFSSKPELVEVKGKTIFEKFVNISNYNDYLNTSIEAVYNLILNVYKSPKFNKEDALERIVIISDMEFDMANCMYGIYDKPEETTFEVFKKELEQLNVKVPEVVFWNVRSRNIHFPVCDEPNVRLVSGASLNIIKLITNNDVNSAIELMDECLEKYSCFNEIKL